MTNGRGSPRVFGRSRRTSGQLASLLLTFQHALLALGFDGLAGSSSKWRRRVRSSTRWWSGFALEVKFHFGQFGSILALLVTRDVDGATSMDWLSINGVAVE